jgi:hypothetical protein
VSHSSAAALHRFEYGAQELASGVELTVERRSGVRLPGVVVHRAVDLRPDDVVGNEACSSPVVAGHWWTYQAGSAAADGEVAGRRPDWPALDGVAATGVPCSGEAERAGERIP